MKQAAESNPRYPLIALVALMDKTHRTPSVVPINVRTEIVVILAETNKQS